MAAPSKYKRRPDGLYQRSITTGRKPDGRPIRKTIYAKTIKELDTRAAEYERQLRHGTLSSNEKITFGELALLWIETSKPLIGERMKARYLGIIKKHFEELKAIRVKDLKPHHLQSIINRLIEKEYAGKTIREIKQTAVQILALAMDNDIVYRNVFERVTVPELDAQDRRALTQKEQELVVNTWQGHRMGLPALLMMYCGLRRGELIALTWRDVNVKAKTITVNKAAFYTGNQPQLKAPKSKAGERTIPIPDKLLPMLSGRHAASMMVCPSVQGKMMSGEAFRRAWESYWRHLNLQAGGSDKKRGKNDANGKPTWIPAVHAIDNITPHMLRHTYATMLYNAGVDVKSAQKFLGHADLNVTLKIYTHLSEEREQSAIAAMNGYLNGDKGSEKTPIEK